MLKLYQISQDETTSASGTSRHSNAPLESVAAGVLRTWLDRALARTDRE
jgi:hypothetical protein